MVSITTANGKDEFELISLLRGRSTEVDKTIAHTVNGIIDDVKARGDAAVREYTTRFDGSCPDVFEVPREQINNALTAADPAFVDALLNAQVNIAEFHNRQKQQSFVDFKPNGVIMGQRIRGLARVGLYVPGGTAAYPSSVLMNAIPAKIAGVGELIMVTPPMKNGKANPDILTAAAIACVDRIFLVGGAQAVAALAFGTQSIPKVDKIVGPGNIYVATAKKLLYGVVDIDMIAGPSEILIMADSTAEPRFLAADMMSQAEHDKLASSILLTTDQSIAEQTIAELNRQVQTLERRDIILESLKNYGAVIVCRNTDEMVALANLLAPEHLEVMLENPMEYIGRLDNAGSIFLGKYSPEPLGDYYAGPNHVLPTSGTARFFSPLSVDSFIKKSSYIYYTVDALHEAHDDAVLIANKEGLTAHANSIQIRF